MIVIQLPITSIHRVLIMHRDNIALQKRLSVPVTLSLIHCPGRLLQETFKNKQGPIDLKTSSKEVSIVLSIYCQSSQVFYVTKFSILRCGIRTHDLGQRVSQLVSNQRLPLLFISTLTLSTAAAVPPGACVFELYLRRYQRSKKV